MVELHERVEAVSARTELEELRRRGMPTGGVIVRIEGIPDAMVTNPSVPFPCDGETVLAVSDWGRQDALRCVMRRCCGNADAPTPAHVVAADVYGTGELAWSWQEHMLVAGAGERPLGIQVAEILALARWARSEYGSRKVSLHASGTVIPVAGLIAVALEPLLFSELVTESLISSLKRLMDYPVDYEQAAPLFCFGLFERFDLPDLVRMCEGVSVRDPSRGPLQARDRKPRGRRK